LLREPVAHCLRVAGKCRSFADAQKKARGKQRFDSRGSSRGKRGYAPDNRADPTHAPDAKAIEQEAAGKLQGSVRPVVEAREVAEGYRGDSEGVGQGLLGNGQIYAVEVIDKDAETQQERDAPTAAWDLRLTSA
jgi:hypothetical protein